jgi:hypothetical protein
MFSVAAFTSLFILLVWSLKTFFNRHDVKNRDRYIGPIIEPNEHSIAFRVEPRVISRWHSVLLATARNDRDRLKRHCVQ